MSRAFNNDAANYLRIADVPVSSKPFTMACWGYLDDVTADHAMMMIGDADSNAHWLLAASSTNLIAQEDSGVPDSAVLSSILSADEWFHAAAVFINDTSRKVYFNGTTSAEQTDNNSGPATVNETTIGVWSDDGVLTAPFEGRLAEAGVWNVALSDSEMEALAAGMSPLMVRPDALKAYWPLFPGEGAGDATDWAGSNPMVEGGTVTATAHPPQIIYPHEQIYHVPVAAAAVGQLLRPPLAPYRHNLMR